MQEPQRNDADTPPPAGSTPPHGTVEEAVRARLTSELGGPRGSVETALPVAVFTVVYVVSHALEISIGAAVSVALLALGLRLVQHSDTRFARHGLFGIVIAGVVASFTGRAEDAFLPGIVQNGLWTLALGGSLLVGRPAAGYLIGAALDDVRGWLDDPGMVRLGKRLTIVLLAPMVIRLAVQVPLYLAGAVGWLGFSRVLLGWPLHLVTLAVAGAILLRGNTPLRAPPV